MEICKLPYSGDTIAEVYLDEVASTTAAMEYIRDNGIPSNINTHFVFKYGERLVVNKEEQPTMHDWVDSFIHRHPLNEWHEVLGMHRYKVAVGWLACINGEYYFMS